MLSVSSIESHTDVQNAPTTIVFGQDTALAFDSSEKNGAMMCAWNNSLSASPDVRSPLPPSLTYLLYRGKCSRRRKAVHPTVHQGLQSRVRRGLPPGLSTIPNPSCP